MSELDLFPFAFNSIPEPRGKTDAAERSLNAIQLWQAFFL